MDNHRKFRSAQYWVVVSSNAKQLSHDLLFETSALSQVKQSTNLDNYYIKWWLYFSLIMSHIICLSVFYLHLVFGLAWGFMSELSKHFMLQLEPRICVRCFVHVVVLKERVKHTFCELINTFEVYIIPKYRSFLNKSTCFFYLINKCRRYLL
jgi:hypothetical protein